MTSKIKKVKSVWSSDENTVNRYGKGFHWVESSIVMEAINKKISGNLKKDWVTYVIENYLSKAKGTYVGLSLGCGIGILERQIQQNGIFKKLDAYDFAKGAIKQAKTLAKKEKLKINYKVDDLNKLRLKKNTYDFIFANSVLHHLENLEFVIDQMDRALVSNGAIFVSEYVGPSQFQYTEEQVKIINNILELLSDVYRKRVTDPNLPKPLFIPPTKEFMNMNDPSEAIRSSEIVSLLKKKFDVVEHKDFGGTILHMLLQDIAGNFNSEDPRDVTVVKLLIYFEEYLIKSKILKSDFIFLILKKKKYRKSFLFNFISNR